MALKVLCMEPLDGIINIVLNDPVEGVGTKQRIIDVPPDLMAKYEDIENSTVEERLALLRAIVALPTHYDENPSRPAQGKVFTPDSLRTSKIPDEIRFRKSPFHH
jgi:hypothetical protein